VTEVHLEVMDEGGQVAREHLIVINDPPATFEIKTEQIAVRLWRDLDGQMLDLLDISAAVFAADSTETRGGPTRSDFGAGWRRHFRFRIALRHPELWERPDLKAALIDAVSFLTDDVVEFSFVRGVVSDSSGGFLNLYPDAPAGFRADEIILFSGGLDSLAGAIEALATTDRRVVLVTHRSAQKMIAHQDRLAQALSDRFPGRVLYIPVTARRRGSEARETTQRSRSFLFAALGHVIARLFGASSISFYENGIVSHNLPISPQVIGSMATRTTHPLSLLRLEAFLCAIEPQHHVRIENHFGWLTKTEIVEKISRHGCAGLIRDAVSCTHVRDQTILHTHCGACSQCLDRRFAILAAGLDKYDPAESYHSDVISGKRSADQSRTLALDWTRHKLHLSTISPLDFLDLFAGELARITEGLHRLSRNDALQMAHAMHQRHGQMVKQVLQAELGNHSAAVLDQTLPATSLLRLIVADRAGDVVIPAELTDPRLHPAPRGGEIAVVDASTSPGISPLVVSAWEDGGRAWISVAGLDTIGGNGARVVHALLPNHRDDTMANLPLDKFRYTQAGTLGTTMNVGKPTVTRAVKLCRDVLAKAWEAVEGIPPLEPILIENRRQHGYRLDPSADIISGAPPQG
jgi:7-cyano-7-deazaguanine synthase in queuosine biosynthesis